MTELTTRIVVLSLACGFALVCSTRAGEMPVPLDDPGFEDPNSSWEKTSPGWRASFSSAAEAAGQETTGVVQRDETEAHSGSASALLKSEGPRYARLHHSIKFLPGGKYRLTAWVRFIQASAANQIRVAVRGRLTNQEQWARSQRAEPTQANEWVQLFLEFTVPEDSRPEGSVELSVLYSKGPVEAWFDDVELVELTD